MATEMSVQQPAIPLNYAQEPSAFYSDDAVHFGRILLDREKG